MVATTGSLKTMRKQAALAGALLVPLKTGHEKGNEGTHEAHPVKAVFEESDVLN